MAFYTLHVVIVVHNCMQVTLNQTLILTL